MLDFTRLLPLSDDPGLAGQHAEAGSSQAAESQPNETRPKNRDAEADEEETEVLAAVAEGQRAAKHVTNADEPAWLAAEKARRARFAARFKTLNGRLCELLQDFNLVSFIPCSVIDKESLLKVLQAADKAHGFVPVGNR